MWREAALRLELFVEEMEASIAFYTQVLAFELARHEPGDYASLRLGGVILGIGPVAKLPEEGGYFGRWIAGAFPRTSWTEARAANASRGER